MLIHRIHLALVIGGLCAGTAMAADAPPSQSLWMQADIAVFRERFVALDKSFTPESRAQAHARLEDLSRRTNIATPAEFAVELCRIVALADNGHTRCMSKASAVELCRQWKLIAQRLPPDCEVKESATQIPEFGSVAIRFRPFGSDFHVVSVGEKDSDLLGARLVGIGGRAIEDVRTLLRSFSGGTVGYRDLRAAGVLASPERLHAVGLAQTSRAVTYELMTSQGRRIERTFELGANTESSARRARAPAGPWSMQEANIPFRFRDAPEQDAVVIQLRQNVDSPNDEIERFLEASEATRARLGRKNVILDMRFNGGGNMVATRDFIVNWPSRTPGHFYVLTSAQTFSAGIVSVAYLKQAAGDRMRIIGEPVGDRLMYFSDGVPVRLPHSGLTIYMSRVRIDLHDGCRKYDDCHESISQPGSAAAPLPAGTTSIKRMPISVATLQPDVVAAWTIESWINGTDPMLEAVAALLEQR